MYTKIISMNFTSRSENTVKCYKKRTFHVFLTAYRKLSKLMFPAFEAFTTQI